MKRREILDLYWIRRDVSMGGVFFYLFVPIFLSRLVVRRKLNNGKKLYARVRSPIECLSGSLHRIKKNEYEGDVATK